MEILLKKHLWFTWAKHYAQDDVGVWIQDPVELVLILFLPQFRLFLVSKIATLTISAITICMIVPTFLGFKGGLVFKKLIHSMSKHAKITIRAVSSFSKSLTKLNLSLRQFKIVVLFRAVWLLRHKIIL